MIKHVDYIWNATSFPTWNSNGYINTGIYAVDDIEIRVAYQGAGANVDRIAGFFPADGVSDSDDFRLFFYSNGSLDVKNTRQSGLFSAPPTQSGVDYDITFGNRFVYDNLTQTSIFSGTQVSSINQSCTIRVDVNGQKVKSLQIKKNGVVVFDAFAALDNSNNIVGLYDTVSDTMFTNNSLNLTYGEIINTFKISPENMSFGFSGGSSALTITADGGWTASTNESWLALSSTEGTGDATITVTANENTSFQPKLGTINVTDGSDTLTCSISQEKNPVLVKSDNIYIEDTLIKKMYLNGALIYQNLFKFIFNVSTSAETIDGTGGTFTATITANRPWSITTPEWISASTVSGKSSATVTFTVGENSGETQRTGNISVICNGVTKQINVSQKSQIDYTTMYLTFEIISGGTFGYSFWTNLNWEYTTDDGATWTTIPSFGAFSISVNVGDKIKMRGNESGGYGSNWFGWSTTTAKFNVYGNIMSIIDSVNYATMTTVPTNCFQYFFNNCNGLVSAENLILPATTLGEGCYYEMFYNCTSLTTAPELPATTLANNCYGFMFYGCSSLNYIKCLATDILAGGCTSGWVNGVSATGTFVKNASMSSWTTGNDGIPTGWTVQDA